MTSQFYNSWKKKTKLEEGGIKSLKSAKKIILENIPKKEIIAIYVKGSFVRREMNKKSDIDTVTILKTSKYLPKLKKLEKKYRTKFKPQLQIAGYSLWELKTGKKSKIKKKISASTSRFVKHLPHHKLIYGKLLNINELNEGDDKNALKGMVGAFRKYFLPGYKNKKMGFSEIAKQVFWLVENEQKTKGKNPPHNWKKLAKSIKNKNHIIHDTLKLRLKPTKDKRKRNAFIKKLEEYLKDLENNFKLPPKPLKTS